MNTDPGLPNATVTWEEPSASDNSGLVTLTSNHNSGESFSVGNTTVTYTAFDANGNNDSDIFTVTVIGK